MGLTKAKEKEYAKLLFTKENLSQKEIAERVSVSEKTVSKWVNDGKWQQMRRSMLVTKDHNLFLLYEQLQSLNEEIQDRAVKYGSIKEIQSIAMLTTSIERLEIETSVGQVVTVARDFIDFVRQIDLDKAKEVTTLFDSFIQQKMK